MPKIDQNFKTKSILEIVEQLSLPTISGRTFDLGYFPKVKNINHSNPATVAALSTQTSYPDIPTILHYTMVWPFTQR